MPNALTPEQLAALRIQWLKAGNPDPDEGEWIGVFPTNEDDDPIDHIMSIATDTLVLSGIGLNDVPDALFDLKNIRMLMLGNQPLKSLPDRIGEMTELETLDLTFTDIEVLPPNLFQLPNLTELYLQGSNIKRLPVELGQAALKILTLSKTRLEDFPDLSNCEIGLKSLSFSNFKAATLPVGVFSVHSLIQLRCDDSAIEFLPNEISQLTSLLQFDISNCHLTTLPRALADVPFERNFAKLRDDITARRGPSKSGKPHKISHLFGIQLSGNPFADRELRNISRIKNPEKRTIAVQAWCRANGD